MAEVRYCTKCGHQVDPSNANACAFCGNLSQGLPHAETEGSASSKSTNAVRAIVGLVVFIASIWFFLGGGLENKVASDAVQEYEIAKRNGTAMDACVHAGLVAAAYLQAKDESNYQQWKATERADCAAAGLPGQ